MNNGQRGWGWRGLLLSLVASLMVVGLGGCGDRPLSLTPAPSASPLPAVASLSAPTLPDWIEAVSPVGSQTNQEGLSSPQIRVRFQSDLIPLEAVDQGDQSDLLSQFTVVPPLAGEFRFLTPRLVAFQAAEAIPVATRVQVQIKAGLADLAGNQLATDLAWSFETEPLMIAGLPQRTEAAAQAVDLSPTVAIATNTPVDVASLADHTLWRDPQGNLVPVTVEAISPAEMESSEAASGEAASDEVASGDEDSPRRRFDPSRGEWQYEIRPRRPLERGTRYRLEITAGVEPQVGNVASQQPVTGELETYHPLAPPTLTFEDLPSAWGAEGRFGSGRAVLTFNNPLKADLLAADLAGAIAIDPAPEGDDWWQWRRGQLAIALNPWVLEPRTTYQLEISTALEDIFGQHLAQPTRLTFTTDDLAPDFWAPEGLNIFPAGPDLQLNLSAVNLPRGYQGVFRSVDPAELVYAAGAYPRGEAGDLLPPTDQWPTVPWTEAAAGENPNQVQTLSLPLREILGQETGLVAYGVKAQTYQYQESWGDRRGQLSWREPEFYGLVQLTNLGVFAQWFPTGGQVRVHHLSDGSPAAVDLTLYPSLTWDPAEPYTPNPTPCATARTDASGVATLGAADLEACYQRGQNQYSEVPELLVIAREGSDWAFTRTESYSGAYGYGVFASWPQDSQPESRGTIFSDRQLYQPGETVHLTGVAYLLQDGQLQKEAGAAYQLALIAPDGRETALPPQTVNEFGTFSWVVPLSERQPLGFYSVVARNGAGVELTGEFRVATFRPPNFQVDLDLGERAATLTAGQSLTPAVTATYLFGAPVAQSQVRYQVTRQPQTFTPPGWDDFTFGPRWSWPEDPPTVPSDVGQVTANLDDAGQGQASFEVAADLPFPMAYQVSAEVTDVANLAVTRSQSVLALPGDRLLGLQHDWVGQAGQPTPITVVVTDPTGQLLRGQRVHLELQARQFSQVTQRVEGSETARNQVVYETVAATDLTSADVPQTVELTPPQAGAYRLQATFPKAFLSPAPPLSTRTDSDLWVTGTDLVNWGNRDNQRLTITLDRETYAVGETATALIQSPYPEAELHLAVIRDRPLFETTIPVTGSAPQVQFTVTEAMLPNAAVEAFLVRQGEPLAQVEAGAVTSLTRIGLAPFQTAVAGQYLQVAIAPAADVVAPGDTQTLALTLQDADGQPVAGQFTVMVVNEAVLQLTGYRPPNLVDIVYAEQPITTRFSDNRPDVVLAPLLSPLAKGWGYGGGLSAGLGSTRLRDDFRPLAFYDGSIVSNEAGEATVSFPLPDDLTTWRVMVVATDRAQHFGQSDVTFQTQQPLVTQPLLPQFVRPGDRLDVGVTITPIGGPGQTTETPATITSQLRGGLRFAANLGSPQDLDAEQRSVQTTTLRTDQTQAIRWPVVATQAGTAETTFRVETAIAQDGVQVSLPIVPLETTETTSLSGVIRSGEGGQPLTLPLVIAANADTQAGGLTVNLGTTLLTRLQAPLAQWQQQEALPLLEAVTSRLAITAQWQQLDARLRPVITEDATESESTESESTESEAGAVADLSTPAALRQGIDQLLDLQVASGGFGSWPGAEEANPFLTPEAVQSLVAAQQAGATVPSDALDQARDYLQTLVANPGQEGYCQQLTCRAQVRLAALFALADLGDARQDYLPDLVAQWAQLDVLTQLRLTRYLSRFATWQAQATTFGEQLDTLVSEGSRTSRLDLPTRWAWLRSPTVLQAEALQLAIAQNRPPERWVQGLFDRQQMSRLETVTPDPSLSDLSSSSAPPAGQWPTPYDTAHALTALLRYQQTLPTPTPLAATVTLGGQPWDARSLTDDGFSGQWQQPTASLDPGPQTLALTQSDDAPLYYQVSYRYRPLGNLPGRFQGLQLQRTIQAAGEAGLGGAAAQVMGRTAPETPFAVGAGQVFVVTLDLTTDRPVDQVVITDPLPAGLEAIDTTFETTPTTLGPATHWLDTWQLRYQTLGRDQVSAFADQLSPGVYRLRYWVRSVTPGTFLWPGASAQQRYAPETFGRTAAALITIE